MNRALGSALVVATAMIRDSIALDTRQPTSRTAAACGLERPDCPHRRACDRDAACLARARAGSRADFDALYDRTFALFYGAASKRLRSRELAERCTRELMEGFFLATAQTEGCSSAQIFRLVKRLGVQGTRVADGRPIGA
jgi:hypothetical protein